MNGNTKEKTVIENIDPDTGEPMLSKSEIAAIAKAELKRIRKNKKRAKEFSIQRKTGK